MNLKDISPDLSDKIAPDRCVVLEERVNNLEEIIKALIIALLEKGGVYTDRDILRYTITDDGIKASTESGESLFIKAKIVRQDYTKSP